MIDEHQCTIVWYVDDFKISHVDPAVVGQQLDLLKQEFGQLLDLTVTDKTTTVIRELSVFHMVMNHIPSSVCSQLRPHYLGHVIKPYAIFKYYFGALTVILGDGYFLNFEKNMI